MRWGYIYLEIAISLISFCEGLFFSGDILFPPVDLIAVERLFKELRNTLLLSCLVSYYNVQSMVTHLQCDYILVSIFLLHWLVLCVFSCGLTENVFSIKLPKY
jgi:hypothetical protein